MTEAKVPARYRLGVDVGGTHTDLVLNDNDIKSRIIAAINEYFALENWDFGDKFFFSENNIKINKLSLSNDKDNGWPHIFI